MQKWCLNSFFRISNSSFSCLLLVSGFVCFWFFFPVIFSFSIMVIFKCEHPVHEICWKLFLLIIIYCCVTSYECMKLLCPSKDFPLYSPGWGFLHGWNRSLLCLWKVQIGCCDGCQSWDLYIFLKMGSEIEYVVHSFVWYK